MPTPRSTRSPDSPRSPARLAISVALLLVSLGIGLTACSGNGSTASIEVDSTAGDEALGTASEALQSFAFKMVPSAASAAAGCLAHARANVRIISAGQVEIMEVDAAGLPPSTEFDFFVIQVPNAPFGLSWYQGDMRTNAQGRAFQTFIGRFNPETFIVAPGVAPAPTIHDDPPFPDACQNPQTAPVHTFHLGLWFNSPADAVAAGCGNATTPFNGEHNAGPQAMSTRNFPNEAGPLLHVQ
jgi:hypothetical protein